MYDANVTKMVIDYMMDQKIYLNEKVFRGKIFLN